MPRLIVESDTYKPPRSTGGLIKDSTALVLSVIAIGVSILQPFSERKKERNDDLLTYRNLACFAVRYLDARIPDLKSGKHLNDMNSIETIVFSINQVKVTELPDPSLVEGFIEIRRSTEILQGWERDYTQFDKRQLDEAKQRADEAMGKTDGFISDNHLPTNKFAGGCSSSTLPSPRPSGTRP